MVGPNINSTKVFYLSSSYDLATLRHGPEFQLSYNLSTITKYTLLNFCKIVYEIRKHHNDVTHTALLAPPPPASRSLIVEHVYISF